MSSTSSRPQLSTQQTQKLRERFTQFRILVIGRANAGKTTILRKLCNATGEPMIFDPTGKKMESSTLDPSLERGEHNIQDAMIFETNSGFVFHDSRGFEAGGDWELKLVQEFIAQRSKARNVDEQLHAIWYCIPTSDDRPITAAERKFFNECGTGHVPVIVLWTKTDSLDLDKIKQLMKEGNNKAEAMEQAPKKAWADFEKKNYPIFNSFKYPPKAYVVFRNMHQSGADCDDLIEKTAASLSSKELQRLFLSTQQNNVEICLKYGIERIVFLTDSDLFQYFSEAREDWTCFIAIVLKYFPNVWIGYRLGEERSRFKKFELEFEENKEREEFFFEEFYRYGRERQRYDITSLSKIMSSILSRVELSSSSNLKGAIYCAIVAAIIGHLHFFLIKESSDNKPTLKQAVQIYLKSASNNAVNLQTVENLFKASSVDDASSKDFKHHFDKELLVKGALQIALDNLLWKY